MHRLDFLKKLSLVPFLSIGAHHLWANSSNHKKTMLEQEAKKHSLIKPKALKKGDTVALIAPSSSMTEEKLQKAIANIERMGLKAKLGKNVMAQNGYFAGTTEQRLEDLHAAFQDPEVQGIWCVRGGYGAARLLPLIDFDLIKKNPKVLIGYSDITALHLSILQKTGLVTFHGPLGTSEYTDYTLQSAIQTLQNPTPTQVVSLCKETNTDPLFKPEVITKGKAKGQLIGGNLSLLSAAAGTPYFMDIKGKILYIEEIDERPYRVDRMLTQLHQALDLSKAAAIVMGVFAGCERKEGDTSLTLSECLHDILGNLGIPVVYGLSFGHVPNQFTIPVGINAEINTDTMTLTFLESGVK